MHASAPCPRHHNPTHHLPAADITTLLLDPAAFAHVIDMLAERYQGQSVDVVAGAFHTAGLLTETWSAPEADCAGATSLICSITALQCEAEDSFLTACMRCTSWDRLLQGHRLPCARMCQQTHVIAASGRACWRCAGFEARGFIFGPPLALRLKVPFVPLRKLGKLPGAPQPGQSQPGEHCSAW